MIDAYTRMLESVAETGDEAAADAAVTKLLVHLKSIGHLKMLPQIVTELRRIVARREALHPQVEVAHEKDAKTALHAAKEAGIEAKQARVNPTLIHGWRARGGGKLIDHSAKNALIHIYQKVTS